MQQNLQIVIKLQPLNDVRILFHTQYLENQCTEEDQILYLGRDCYVIGTGASQIFFQF